jgi:hypothetical protein
VGLYCWSPRKVKEACDCQLGKELEEKQLQHQKVEAACLHKEKLKAVKAGHAARAAARLMRQGEKACEAANQASQAAACRAQQ